MGTADDRTKLGDVAGAAGLRRVHILAWRDLDDIEAGGSEVHAGRDRARVGPRRASTCVVRTSHAHGQLTEITTRRLPRDPPTPAATLVFLDAPVQELLRRGGSARRPPRGVERPAVLRSAVGPGAARDLHPPRPRRHVATGDDARAGPARRGARAARRPAPLPAHPGPHALAVVPAAHHRAPGAAGRQRDRGRRTASTSGSAPAGPARRTPAIVTVGRLVVHKHVERLIAAAARGPAAVPDLELRHRRARATSAPASSGSIDDLDAEGWVHLRGGVTDDELVDAPPIGVGHRQRLVRRGLGADAHRGGRVRHPCGGHPHRRPRRQRVDDGAHRAAGRLRRRDGRRARRRAHRRLRCERASAPARWPMGGGAHVGPRRPRGAPSDRGGPAA